MSDTKDDQQNSTLKIATDSRNSIHLLQKSHKQFWLCQSSEAEAASYSSNNNFVKIKLLLDVKLLDYYSLLNFAKV